MIQPQQFAYLVLKLITQNICIARRDGAVAGSLYTVAILALV